MWKICEYVTIIQEIICRYFFPKIFLIFSKIPCVVGVYGLPFLPFFQNLKKHVYATNKLHLHMYNVGMFELNSHYEIIHAQWAKKQKKSNFKWKKFLTPGPLAPDTIHLTKFQKTLILVFEANSVLSCQNGLFSSL